VPRRRDKIFDSLFDSGRSAAARASSREGTSPPGSAFSRSRSRPGIAASSAGSPSVATKYLRALFVQGRPRRPRAAPRRGGARLVALDRPGLQTPGASQSVGDRARQQACAHWGGARARPRLGAKDGSLNRRGAAPRIALLLVAAPTPPVVNVTSKRAAQTRRLARRGGTTVAGRRPGLGREGRRQPTCRASR